MIRIATIGTSMITENLIEVLSQHERARFVGTFSRDAGRAAAFTAEHGGSTPFSSLDELAASDEVDAVYIASPNALHCKQTLACIAGGKHVLVEKPFASCEREAHEMFGAAARAGVILMEAMRPIHDPAFQICKDALPELGRIRRANLRFGKYSSRYDDILAGRRTNIFDCNMASGSLMDIGVYCVEPMLDLFGEPDCIVAVVALLDEGTRDLTNGRIDGAGTILARYPDMVVTLDHSKITNDLLPSQIEGELATLTIDKISTPEHARIEYRGTAVRNAAKRGYSAIHTSSRELELPSCDNTMCYELDDFIGAVEAVRAGTPADAAPCGNVGNVNRMQEITLAALAIMDDARLQTGVCFPADE